MAKLYTLRAYGVLTNGRNLRGHHVGFLNSTREELEKKALEYVHLMAGYLTLSEREEGESYSCDTVITTYGNAPSGLIGTLAMTGLPATAANKAKRWVIKMGKLFLGKNSLVTTKAAAYRFYSPLGAQNRIDHLKEVKDITTLIHQAVVVEVPK